MSHTTYTVDDRGYLYINKTNACRFGKLSQAMEVSKKLNLHDELVDALVNSNIELVSLLNKVTSVTDRTMIHLRMDANSRIINQARGE
mgnify:CR=1 FL=1